MSTLTPIQERTAAKIPPKLELSAIIVNWPLSQITFGALGGAIMANVGADGTDSGAVATLVTTFAAGVS
jgi:hypothetical protein